ncbi:MAG: methyltransferase domain-containing protein [Nanoarchaeota archaeon]|nr:methyltransferase domain-containing protein [Nanoarchaeota archaeon]
MDKKLVKILICPECFGGLLLKENNLICNHCQKIYLVVDNKPWFLEKIKKDFSGPGGDSFILKLKVFFKKYPKIFKIFYYLFGASFVGRSAQKAINDIRRDKIILNLGSGIKKIRDDVVNVDFYPFNNVDIIADITHLPFADASVDAVINEDVLEHISDPLKVISEIKRILKPNGLLYLTVPFIEGFHSSPNDYYRWSKEGLRELTQDFEELESGIRHGPTSAMLSVVNDWLATILSFGSKNLHQIFLIFFMIIAFPLKVFDYLISKFPSAQNIAFGFYFIGKKK